MLNKLKDLIGGNDSGSVNGPSGDMKENTETNTETNTEINKAEKIVNMTPSLLHDKGNTGQLTGKANMNLAAGADVVSEYVSVVPPMSSAIDLVNQKLPEVSQQIEESTVDLSQKFMELAKTAKSGGEQIEKVVSIVNTLELNGEKITLADFAKLFHTTLDDAIQQILRVAKLAMSVVYSFKETMQSIKEVESITASIQKINRQTNLLSLNASIEAERAGESGRGFVVVANEIRDISNQISDLSKEITNKIDLISRQSKENLVILEEVATADMTESLQAKDKLDDLMASLLEQNERFKEFLHEAAESEKLLSNNIAKMTMGIQFQDRATQYIQNSVVILEAIQSKLNELKEKATSDSEVDVDTGFIEIIMTSLQLSEFKQQFSKNLEACAKIKNKEKVEEVCAANKVGSEKPAGKDSKDRNSDKQDDDGGEEDIELF